MRGWLTMAGVLAVAACGGGGGNGNAPAGGGGAGGAGGAAGAPATGGADFPVNEALAAQFVALGLPVDVARFLAASKIELTGPDASTYALKQTFPNGATREVTMTLTPNQRHTPTDAERASVAMGAPPIYGFTYASTMQPDGVPRIEQRFFVADSLIPDEVRRRSQGQPLTLAQAQGAGDTSGASVYLVDTGKKGADVGIGSLIELAGHKGIPVGSLGSIYALASALSDVSTALDISKEVGADLAELTKLESCAAHPTNPVALSDPNYSKNAVAKCEAARAELQEVSAVRFLNVMTETAAGLNPVTAALSVGMKSGFTWSEQTLKGFTDGTIMKEARDAVVKCDGGGMFNGNVTVVADCTTTTPLETDHEVITITSNVSWSWNPQQYIYRAQGQFMYKDERAATAMGKTCTTTKTAMGDIGGMDGGLMLFDQSLVSVLGTGYVGGGSSRANVARKNDCGGQNDTIQDDLEWLPMIKGLPGAGGVIEGDTTEPYCVGNASMGTRHVTWSFMLPPMK